MQVPAVLIAALALATPAAAGTIAITMTPKARVEGDRLVVELAIGNRGDEAAYEVVPSLALGDQVVEGDKRTSLSPDDRFETTLALPIAGRGEGRWPYRLRVGYADANLYPFEALRVDTLVIGHPALSRVVPAPRLATLEREGVLEVQVKNLAAEARQARVELILPDAIRASEATRELALAGWEETDLAVTLTNESALAGSRHPVFVVTEYDDGDVHQAHVAQGTVVVEAAEAFLVRHGRTLSLVGAGLLAVWAGSVLAVALRRPKTRPA